jgi:hypothetical protein
LALYAGGTLLLVNEGVDGGDDLTNQRLAVVVNPNLDELALEMGLHADSLGAKVSKGKGRKE